MNIGILLPNLEVGQLPFEVISNINSEIINGSKHDYRIFFEDISVPHIKPLCATMSISEIWTYDGLLVSTTLDNTQQLLKLRTNIIRCFYIWDIFWLRGYKDYCRNLSILRSPDLLLISRNKNTADELKKYANRRANIITPKLELGKIANEIANRKIN